MPHHHATAGKSVHRNPSTPATVGFAVPIYQDPNKLNACAQQDAWHRGKNRTHIVSCRSPQ